MAIRKYKPTTNGRRNMSVLTYEEITTDKPEKSLLVPLNKKAGRNAQGVITVRHKGGAEKRKYRAFWAQPQPSKARQIILAKHKTLKYKSFSVFLYIYVTAQ